MFATEIKPEVVPVRALPSAKPSPAWRQIIEPVKPFLEKVANRLAEQVEGFEPEIAAYAQYALPNQGKQMRPALVALSGGASGKVTDSLITVAVIIEMVHLATLVHDDVVDEAEMRRRRPTLAAKWGNQISVLLGDCLFANAVKLAASFPTPEVCRAVASANNTVCSGEILQTQHRRQFGFTRAQYFKVVQMKTAELFALSCDLGAGLSNATGTGRNALRNYGLALGTAYQVYDDCLDLFGSEALVGKSLGTDLASGKLTLPILAVLARGTRADQAKLKELIGHWEPDYFPLVLELLERYEALTECSGIIYEYLEAARQSLEILPDSDSGRALVALTEFLAQQTELLGVSN